MKLEYALVSALTASIVFTYISHPLAHRLGVLDNPTALKIHHVKVARFGGFGIFCGFVAGILLAPSIYRPLLVGAGVMWIVGAIDDRWTISSVQKLAGEALAGIILAYLIFTLHHNVVGLTYGILGFLLAVFFSNAVNLIDGMNGLAGGNALLIYIGMAVLLLLHGSYAGVALIAAAAVLGFLPFNFPKARVFMGDSGSLLLGYIMAYLLMQLMFVSVKLFFCGFIVVLLPAFDLMLGIARRIASRRSILTGDRGHFYDQINELTKNNTLTVVITYASSALLSIIGIALSFATLPTVIGGFAVLASVIVAISVSRRWVQVASL